MPTLLIVDDSPTIRRMVKASMGGASELDFLEASSGLEAIEVLGVRAVHAMVLDLNMPDMHGFDVLRFVRSHDRYRVLPVLVLTTRGDATSRDAAMEAGASAYMTKPFSPSALSGTIQGLFDGASALNQSSSSRNW